MSPDGSSSASSANGDTHPRPIGPTAASSELYERDTSMPNTSAGNARSSQVP